MNVDTSTEESGEYLPMDDYALDDIVDDDNDDAGFDLTSELDFEDDEESIDEPVPTEEFSREKIGWQEQLRMIHFRSHLNELNKKVEKCQFDVDKAREELKKCNAHLHHLEVERDELYRQIEEAENAGNTAAIYRLRAGHEKICREIDGEQEVICNIRDRVEQAEYDFAKADVERGKYVLLEEELIQKEQQLQSEKTDMAKYRLHKEQTLAKQSALQKQKQARLQEEALMELEQRHRRAVVDAQQSHERVAKHLSATIEKLRKRQMEEDWRSKEDMQRKVEMLLKLKNDIVTNRENLRALRARDKAREQYERENEVRLRQEILDNGGNPDMAMLIKKRIDSFEREKQQLEAKQREGHIKIMGKILREESIMKKRKKHQRQLFVDIREDREKIVKPLPKKPLKIFEKFCQDSGAGDLVENVNRASATTKPAAAAEEGGEKKEESGEPMSLALADSSDSESEMEEEESVNLAVPEFEGLWDQHKPYRVPRDTGGELKLPGASKMEKDIMAKVLEKHRQGIIVKQVAAGKQFKGRAFYSKPDIIHFKDFDVGQCYKKKVILTNVSYTVNYCKFVGLTEKLKDFIKIDFDPPGQMSAGLTCEMLVTFKPMINVDLEGEVHFIAQTGPFSIPLKCTTKKCDLRADTKVVEFGTTVIGETLKRTFVLTNKGALGTRFDFFKVTGMKQRTMTTAETSFGRLTTADTIRAVSPDSQEAADRQKQEKDSKKKSSEDLAKLPEGSQDLGEAALPGDGVSSPLSQALPDADRPGDDLDEVMSPDLAVSEMDDYGSLDGMKVGPISSGDIGPFSSVKLEIIWQPTIPGKVDSEFLISFADPLSESISIRALANAIDVPVWVERQSVDLKICMFDRLYQDTIVVNNRATTALRLKFEVCKELRNHLELLPKTGYIQAQSQFSAQLKFLPRKSLFEEAGKLFDRETGVLEAPMTIRVADQTAPVPFTVHAVVTNSDMEFDVSNLNFECCTVYESVKASIKLTNKSILPQRFGFVGLPDYVEVQPDDGFGILLPLETIDLDVIFSPKKAKDYEFELLCKSLVNREFRIKCRGTGVLPPLELSHQVVHFAATALYDISSASINIVNSHTSSNEFTHPVPRIGRGEIAPVGPTSFELKLPDKCPLAISPTVGTILPGEQARVLVHFAPKLDEDDILKEAVRMATKIMEAKAEKDYQEALRREKEAAEVAQQAAGKKGSKGGRASPKGAKGKAGAAPAPGQATTVQKPGPVEPPDPKTITKESPAYHAAIGSLMRQFKGSFETVKIPVFVASGTCGNPGEISYSVHNTLHLDIHCPVVKPPLVVISNNGKTTVDFGEVSIGQTVSQSITLQNISDKRLTLSSSLLDPLGPFTIVNALRSLDPMETHMAIIAFAPFSGRVYQEQLQVKTKNSSLHLKVMGRGVSPKVTLSLDSPEVTLGPVLVGEYCERQFKMNNTSSLAIEYAIKLESQSLLRHAHAQKLPGYIQRKSSKKFSVGTQNNNGQAVFDLTPVSGTIPAGGSKEITITFAPDHESKHYADGVYIELFNQEESHYLQLVGGAYPSIMYLDGYDELLPSVESLSLSSRPPPQDDENSKPPPPSVLLMLKCNSGETENQPVPRDLLVGCVRTMAVSQKKEVKKKNGEFSFENLQAITARGFNIEPPKGMVEAGVKKPVTFTWCPPPNHDNSPMAEASVLVTLKGDTSEQFRVILRAMLVTE